jgi:hypothetical protein
MAYKQLESIGQVFQDMEPELIESRIGILIWRYQVSRSKQMAQSIVTHIEALCTHHDIAESDNVVCAYHRILPMWRVLAGNNLAAIEGGLNNVPLS